MGFTVGSAAELGSIPSMTLSEMSLTGNVAMESYGALGIEAMKILSWLSTSVVKGCRFVAKQGKH